MASGSNGIQAVAWGKIGMNRLLGEDEEVDGVLKELNSWRPSNGSIRPMLPETERTNPTVPAT